MNKKVRMYDVTVRNGYGERHEIVPGVSKAQLKPKFRSEHESVPNIDFIGWADVSVLFSSRDDYAFEMNCGDITKSFQFGDRGFSFLNDQFQEEIENTKFPDDFQ